VTELLLNVSKQYAKQERVYCLCSANFNLKSATVKQEEKRDRRHLQSESTSSQFLELSIKKSSFSAFHFFATEAFFGANI
jgi:hypothetical protein